MRVSREQAAKNREKIVEVASREFRDKGFDGIGVADLMKSAGLTHGGFYGHFASKDDLIAEACGTAMDHSTGKWAKLIETSPENALSLIVESYLSKAHRDDNANGCPMAALAPEIARQGNPVRERFTRGLRDSLDVLLEAMPSGRPGERRREATLATMAGLVGTLVLSRAVNDPDLAEEILAIGRARLGKDG